MDRPDLHVAFCSTSGCCDATSEHQTIPTTAVPELTDGSSIYFPWFTRDLPYGATVLLENVSLLAPHDNQQRPGALSLAMVDGSLGLRLNPLFDIFFTTLY